MAGYHNRQLPHRAVIDSGQPGIPGLKRVDYPEWMASFWRISLSSQRQKRTESINHGISTGHMA